MDATRSLSQIAMLAGAIAIGLWAPPASASARARPDLVVTRVKVTGLSANPYLLLDSQGNTQPFQVHVTTKNVGDAAAGPSETKVSLLGDHTTASALVPVGRLGPRGTDTTIVPGDVGAGFKLGFVRLYANADAKDAVREANEHNNLRLWRRIPVVARKWLMLTFATHQVSSLSGEDVLDQAQIGPSFFRFTRFDPGTRSFLYSADAQLIETVTLTVGNCTGSGQGMATHDPWAAPSELSIRGDLTKYSAVINTASEPAFTITDSCGGTPSVRFVNLETESGAGSLDAMSPSTDTLTGSGTIGSFLKTDWSWDFAASVP
jgi:hypothetical protein